MTERPAAGPSLQARLRWLRKAGPSDYLLALSEIGASLPLVGRSLEPLGGMTAMSVWGMRHMPDFVSATAKALRAPNQSETRRRDRKSSRSVSQAALHGIVAPQDLAGEWPQPDAMPPMGRALWQRKLIYRSAVHYGDSPAQVLDVWRRKTLAVEPAPVMIFLPGGAWVHGSRMMQGYTLLSRLAELGWVCLAIDYRVAPHHPWPRHILDVKTAIAWARANVDKFGGDRDFVTVAGCSAGGHLAALAGLTAGDPAFESELPEGSDTAVDAVVGIYGRYDWEDRSTVERDRFVDFLERVVVRKGIVGHPEIFRDASPIARVHRNAPPFLVIHGSKDSVIPVDQARSFVERLRSTSHSNVGYLELPGAGHGFDLIDGERAGVAAHATALFLNQVHRTRAIAAKEVI